MAYLEGWYVVPELRETGLGRQLIEAAETWARSKGCTELASDTEMTNITSLRAHEACGFEEVSRIRCFLKSLE